MKSHKYHVGLKVGVVFLLWVLLVSALFFMLPPKGSIPILMYHFVVPQTQLNSKGGPTNLDISAEEFERQMWLLRTFGFKPITLDQLYEIYSGKAKPRWRQIVITFDDGNETYMQYALPVMEHYGIPSVNFVVWEFLQNRDHGSMSLSDVQKLARRPLVTIGSHSLSHQTLPTLDHNHAESEIVESKIRLEQALGKAVPYFCYPTGAFTSREVVLVQKAGYRLAFTTSVKSLGNYPETFYSLTRSKVSPKDNLFGFWLRASGLDYCVARVKHWFRQLTGSMRNDKLNVYELAPKTM